MVNSEIIHHEMNEILKIKKKEVNKMRFDKERFFKDLQEKEPNMDEEIELIKKWVKEREDFINE